MISYEWQEIVFDFNQTRMEIAKIFLKIQNQLGGKYFDIGKKTIFVLFYKIYLVQGLVDNS